MEAIQYVLKWQQISKTLFTVCSGIGGLPLSRETVDIDLEAGTRKLMYLEDVLQSLPVGIVNVCWQALKKNEVDEKFLKLKLVSSLNTLKNLNEDVFQYRVVVEKITQCVDGILGKVTVAMPPAVEQILAGIARELQLHWGSYPERVLFGIDYAFSKCRYINGARSRC